MAPSRLNAPVIAATSLTFKGDLPRIYKGLPTDAPLTHRQATRVTAAVVVDLPAGIDERCSESLMRNRECHSIDRVRSDNFRVAITYSTSA